MTFKYQHPEYFKEIPPINYKDYNGNIILFGLGLFGACAARLLEKQGVKILCFADSHQEKWYTDYLGYSVISPIEMKQHYPDVAVMVTPHQIKSSHKQIQEMGYKILISPLFLFLEFDINDVMDVIPNHISKAQFSLIIERYISKLAEFLVFGVLKRLTLAITEQCTLRCIDCMSLIPYFKNPKNHNWKGIIKSLNRLLEIITFDEIMLAGGEILLHPNLLELLELIIESPKIKKITTITNGTVIPSSRLVEVLRCPKIEVIITNYGEISYKFDELVDLFDRENIKYFEELPQWFRCSNVSLHDRSIGQLQDVYANCCKTDGTPYLNRGKLYKCQFAASVDQLGVIPKSPEDSVELLAEPYNPIVLKKKVDELFSRETFIDACKYCKGRDYHAEITPSGRQMIGDAPKLPTYV